ncbi:MAG: beta-lactamase family protein [Alphaproteobacteria bacterium]|nr:beta-lactamase family protein [Alphaproteobacteria bacterium]
MVTVEGTCDPKFERVREAFAGNFRSGDEVGAAVAVMVDGRMVVDLWGGVRDQASGAIWQRDTLACMMSVAKGVTATCMAMLFDRGLLDLEAPVARYWPEFARNGKDAVTVRQIMSHLAGIPVTDAAPESAIYDWPTMIAAIEAQRPIWQPGSTQFYHSATMGHLTGEILRRITGKTIGRFLHDEVCARLGADYAIGLSEADVARCATMIPSAGNVIGLAKAAPPDSLEARMWRPLPASEDFNSRRFRQAEIPAFNGHGTARGVATIYGALARGGELGGIRLLRPEGLAPFIADQPTGRPVASAVPLRMGLGFMLCSPPHRPMGPNLRSFGHTGAGGAQGFADPDARVGFGYALNRMHDGRDASPRATRMIEATFSCL